MTLSIYHELGITLYGAKIYEALVKKGEMKATQIAEASGVPRTKIYEMVMALVDIGWVTIVDDGPLVFKAIKPEIVMKNTLKKKLKSLKEEGEQQVGILQHYYESSQEHLEAEPVQSYPLLGEEECIAEIQSMINKAKDRVLFAIIDADFLKKVYKKLKIPSKLSVRILKRKGQRLPDKLKSRAKIVEADREMLMKGGYFVVDGKEVAVVYTEPKRICGYRLLHTRDRLRLCHELEEWFDLKMLGVSRY